jgi:hypothetical protein
MRNDWEFDKTESKRFDPIKAEEKFILFLVLILSLPMLAVYLMLILAAIL